MARISPFIFRQDIFAITVPLTQIRHIRRARLEPEERQSNDNFLPLEGSIPTTGQFYAQVQVGTPRQSFYVQVDTGSSDLIIYGSTCNSCEAQPSTTYNLDASSSADVIGCSMSCQACVVVNKESACQFVDLYGDGTTGIGGFLVNDLLALPSTEFTNINISFGYVSQATADFQNPPVVGIWGLAYPTFAFAPPTLDSIFAQTGIFKGFSMCLINEDAVMSIGVDYASAPGVSWTPVIQQSYYAVQMTSFKIGDSTLALPSNVLPIVDSGTTQIILPSATFEALKSNLRARCAQVSNLVGVCGVSADKDIFSGDYCYVFSDSELAAYPSISFTLGGISNAFVLTPQQYFIDVLQNGKSCYQFGISTINASTATGQPILILGDVFMSNYHVIFDRANNRVGFNGLSSCPSSTSNTTGSTTSTVTSTSTAGTGSQQFESNGSRLISKTVEAILVLILIIGAFFA